MPIIVDCPGCRKRYEVDASLAGKKSRCKQCGEVFRLPTPVGKLIEPETPPKPAPSQMRSSRDLFRDEQSPSASVSRPPVTAPSSPSRAPSAGKPISVNCPGCGKLYEVDATLGGKKSRCKQCNEVFTIPVPMGIITPLPTKPARAMSQPPPFEPPLVEMELIFDEEPIAFKRSQPKPAPIYEDEELPPPRRIAYPKPGRKSSARRSTDPQLGITVSGWYLALNALAIVGLLIFRSVAEPRSPSLMLFAGIYAVFFYVSWLVMALWGWVWLIVISFRESTTQGVLCLLVPCYNFYYFLTRWDDTRGAFCLHYCPCILVVAFGILSPLMLRGTVFDETTAEGPQVADQQAPNFNNAPAPFPGGQPPRAGLNPFPGRPAFPGMQSPEQQLKRIVEVHGKHAIVVVLLGIPKNTDPANGVTARDVSEAINKRLRELAPNAQEFVSFGGADRSKIFIAPIADRQSFANRIDFGRVVIVKEDLIEVTVSPDFIASVPRLPAEQQITAGNFDNPAQEPEPKIPANADAVTKSLIQLKSPNMGRKMDALHRLERMAPTERVDEVVAALLPLLDDDDGFLVNDVIKTLTVWQTPEVVPALIQRSKDNRFNVRYEAIKALGKSKDVRAVEPLIERFKEDGFQAEDALKELGSIAEPALIARLRDGDREVRRAACKVLSVIGGHDALKAMNSIPQDPDLGTRAAAAEAYRQIVARVGPLPGSSKSSKKGSSSRGPR